MEPLTLVLKVCFDRAWPRHLLLDKQAWDQCVIYGSSILCYLNLKISEVYNRVSSSGWINGLFESWYCKLIEETVLLNIFLLWNHCVGLPSFKPVVYTNPDAVELDEEETHPKQRPTFIRTGDPAYNQGQPDAGYRSHEVHSTSRMHPPSPGPPPYSAVVNQQSPPGPSKPTGARSLQYVVTPNIPEPQYYREAKAQQHGAFKSQVTVETDGGGDSLPRSSQAQGQIQGRQARAPSPFQDRHDFDTTVPSYTTAYSHGEVFPEGVSSRIVYTTKAPPQGQGYVQSRPTNRTEAPPQTRSPVPNMPEGALPQSPTRSPSASSFPSATSPLAKPSSPTTHNPRPYQLKPTLDSRKDEVDHMGSGLSPGEGEPGTFPKEEAEVDALTDLLMKNMQAAGDPDFFGKCRK